MDLKMRLQNASRNHQKMMASLTGTSMQLLVVVYFTALFASFSLKVLHSLLLGNETFFLLTLTQQCLSCSLIWQLKNLKD